MKKFRPFSLLIFLSVLVCLFVAPARSRLEPDLWQIYQQSLKPAKYVDLTHSIALCVGMRSKACGLDKSYKLIGI